MKGRKRILIVADQGGKRPLNLSIRAEGNKALIEIDGNIYGYSGNSAREFKQKITDFLSQGYNDVHVYINSNGGDVFQGNQIVNEIKRFTGKITGEGGAVVASAATYIAVHIDGFSMAQNGMFMIHKPYGGFDGTADEIEGQLKLLRNLESDYKKKYAEKTGKSEAEIEKLWGKGDCWMTATEAKEQGFVSAITGETQITEAMAKALHDDGVPMIHANVKPRPAPQSSKSNNTNKVNELMILALSMGLPQDADIDAIKAQVAKYRVKAEKVDALQLELDNIKENERKAKATASAKEFKALFDAKVAAKAVTEKFRPGFEAKWNIDADETRKEIEALQSVGNASDFTNTGGSDPSVDAARKDWTWDKYQAEDPQALIALAKSDVPKLKALFKANYGQEMSQEVIDQMAEA